ncbi:acetyl-CoA C-acyltransferase [Acidobacteria bacterium AH-259-G07]|nr:acetyl-CoA C-acyltransferase [Acidobacteria bacterium AH-259-G07]
MPENTVTRVAVIGGARTPFVKAGTLFRKYFALDLAVHSVNGLLEKLRLDPRSVDELVYGIVVVDPRISHLAREVVFSSELPSEVRALTVTNNCITGTSAITSVYDSIVAGRAEVGIAGGVESMSNAALLFSKRASRIFLDAASARSLSARVRHFLKLRPWDFKPSAPGIVEPSTGLSMGEHCELMVKEWKIPREVQDEMAYRSHMKAHRATEDGRLKAEIHPLDGINHDLLIRANTSMEKLATLPPVFDRSPTGTITAGNSSPLTDGAASALLMSEERARREGREPLAFIKGFEFVGIDPDDGLLMGPGIAVPRVLRKAGLELSDIDIVEMHEAFGGQIACNLRAWEQDWKEPAIGKVDQEKLNPLGSSIAVGHPFAATGARIVTTLANEMKRRGAKYGLVSICGAGATASAMILERD